MKVSETNPGWIAISQIANVSLSFFTTPFIARALQAEGRGVTASISSMFYLIAVLVSFGIPQYVRQRTSKSQSWSNLASLRWVAIGLNLALAPVFIFVFRLVNLGYSEDEKKLILICLSTAFSAASILIDSNALVARSLYFRVAVVQSAQPTLNFIIICFSFFTNTLTVDIVFISLCISNFFGMILGILLSIKAEGKPKSTLGDLRASARFFGSTALDAISTKAYVALSLFILGAHDAGFFSIAFTFASFAGIVSGFYSSLFYPSLVSSKDQNLKVRRILGVASSLALATLLAMLVAVPIAVFLLFGTTFAPVQNVFTFFMPLIFLNIASDVLTQILFASGRERKAFKAKVVAIPVSLVLFIAGGAFGIGWATLGLIAGGAMYVLSCLQQLGLGLGALRPDWVGALKTLRNFRYVATNDEI